MTHLATLIYSTCMICVITNHFLQKKKAHERNKNYIRITYYCLYQVIVALFGIDNCLKGCIFFKVLEVTYYPFESI